jgi:hypothetical protein
MKEREIEKKGWKEKWENQNEIEAERVTDAILELQWSYSLNRSSAKRQENSCSY